MAARPFPFVVPLILTFFLASFLVSDALVPASRTFKYTNEGDFGEYIVEYDASYRVLPLFTFPFQLCFYNTTPNAFTLAIRMGVRQSESVMRWVWDANRGRPVKDGAVLSFGGDGNLVLTDSDGSIAWQTGTAGKGVVGLSLLSNGNLVLYDSKGKYIWQSFDYPRDTLMVGQSFRASSGPKNLVARVSDKDGSEGPYSFVLEKRHWSLYYTVKNKPLLYYKSDEFGNGQGYIAHLNLYAAPETEGASAFEVGFTFDMVGSSSSGTSILARPKYNATHSILRLGSDGNLMIYTYDDNVDYGAWEVTFKLFDRDQGRESECKLPTRCGNLGVCEDDQCVACPKPGGLLGWSQSCSAPVPKCKGGAVGYYKVVGVEHFLYGYNNGVRPLKLEECRSRCDKDCGCLGFFYKSETSSCLTTPVLGTLVKVANPGHVGYIKIAK